MFLRKNNPQGHSKDRRAQAWPVDPRSSEGNIAWSSVTHDAAIQYDVHCSVGHRYHHYKLLSRELKLTCCSLLYWSRCADCQAAGHEFKHKANFACFCQPNLADHMCPKAKQSVARPSAPIVNLMTLTLSC